MADDPPIVSRIRPETPQSAIDELCEKLPDFCRAYEDDGLSMEEYAEFGPVQLVRSVFMKGWYLLLAEVASRRHFHAL